MAYKWSKFEKSQFSIGLGTLCDLIEFSVSHAVFLLFPQKPQQITNICFY